MLIDFDGVREVQIEAGLAYKQHVALTAKAEQRLHTLCTHVDLAAGEEWCQPCEKEYYSYDSPAKNIAAEWGKVWDVLDRIGASVREATSAAKV